MKFCVTNTIIYPARLITVEVIKQCCGNRQNNGTNATSRTLHKITSSTDTSKTTGCCGRYIEKLYSNRLDENLQSN